MIYQQTLLKIGNKLIELRKSKGYTSHEKFAHDHELPRVQYWRLERGRANCTVKSLMTVLEVHDLTLEDFFQLLKSDSTNTNGQPATNGRDH